MSSSSEQFENNEDDLKTLLTSLASRVETRLARLAGEDRKSAVREGEREIDEAQALVKEMREEAAVAPPQYRSQMMTKVGGRGAGGLVLLSLRNRLT